MIGEPMGCHDAIKHDKFPAQGKSLGKPVSVCFHYDTTHSIPGVIVRNDIEEPFVTAIRLEDGRVALATECQYSHP
jgi:hypothetical protein